MNDGERRRIELHVDGCRLGCKQVLDALLHDNILASGRAEAVSHAASRATPVSADRPPAASGDVAALREAARLRAGLPPVLPAGDIDKEVDTSASLLARLRGPTNPAAWARFVDLYTPLLHYWARRTGLQEADAADLVQEVLVLLFRKLPQFTYDRRKSFRGWLHTVLIHKLGEIRRRRAPAVAGGDAELSNLAESDVPAEIEEAVYRRHLVHQALRKLQGEFPTNQWKAFDKYVVNGNSAEAVAKELGVCVGTVYAAKSRVLSRLRRELDGLLD
jgi:RNA polymerase sigma-70 factor (ECF subfamily)